MLSIVTCVVASCALILATFSLVAALRMRALLPNAAKWTALRAEFGDLTEAVESLQYRLRRLSSKVAMREKRERDKPTSESSSVAGFPDPKEDPEAWKAAVNNRIAIGGIASYKS